LEDTDDFSVNRITQSSSVQVGGSRSESFHPLDLPLYYESFAPQSPSGAADPNGMFKGATWITIDVTPLVTGNGMLSLALIGLNSKPRQTRDRS
ncbi:MAG TPA: hypothetical protein VFY83_08345, partial [Anaerolineales bacterium]|nr:hypothetical protein [Anaerolineales bacterium]